MAAATLLTAAAVVAALIGVRAAILADDGSDTRHDSIREEMKRGAAIREDARYVYQGEAPAALDVLEVRFLSEELRRRARQARGRAGDALVAEAAARAGQLSSLRQGVPLLTDPQYAPAGSGYDLASRLVDVRAGNAALRDIDPDRTEDTASRLASKSTLLLAVAVLVAVAFFCGALAQGFPRLGRSAIVVGWTAVGVAVVAVALVEVAI